MNEALFVGGQNRHIPIGYDSEWAGAGMRQQPIRDRLLPSLTLELFLVLIVVLHRLRPSLLGLCSRLLSDQRHLLFYEIVERSEVRGNHDNSAKRAGLTRNIVIKSDHMFDSNIDQSCLSHLSTSHLSTSHLSVSSVWLTCLTHLSVSLVYLSPVCLTCLSLLSVSPVYLSPTCLSHLSVSSVCRTCLPLTCLSLLSVSPVYLSPVYLSPVCLTCLPLTYLSSCNSLVAIDSKVERAMDLVKTHLMVTVREEVELLREAITELQKKNKELERENHNLRTHNYRHTETQLHTL
ncbi:unnamed protein product [Pleuronectes platessa]|uniref:TSC22 domain family protein 1 n=1 Tax=Pleuronectes platessa TaxID=8262 RepID=A0A9N7UL05_PLEPL|nr:unnamed protein product [Pleuronectes platessa]